MRQFCLCLELQDLPFGLLEVGVTHQSHELVATLPLYNVRVKCLEALPRSAWSLFREPNSEVRAELSPVSQVAQRMPRDHKVQWFPKFLVWGERT